MLGERDESTTLGEARLLALQSFAIHVLTGVAGSNVSYDINRYMVAPSGTGLVPIV